MSSIEELSINEKSKILEKLQASVMNNRVEELEILLKILNVQELKKNKRLWFNRVMKVIRKIAHKKYRNAFEDYFPVILGVANNASWMTRGCWNKIEKLKKTVEKRFS